GLGSVVMRTLPRSFPFHFALNLAISSLSFEGSRFRSSAASMGSPEIVPSIPADHASGKPWSLAYCGATRSIRRRVYDQLRPNGPHGSSATFERPYDLNRSAAHSAAATWLGDAVSLGPCTSVSQERWSMTFDRSKASDLISCTSARSGPSAS